MKTIIIVILLGFFALVEKSQSQPWQVLSSSTTNNITDVEFINSNLGFFSSSDGVIKRTTDGGISWEIVLSQTIKIYSLYFVNENLGFGSGGFGRIFKTTNSGLNWIVTAPTGYNLLSIFFTNEFIGYAVGAQSCIIKTTNGGQTWFNQISPLTNLALTEVCFSGSKGYISVSSAYTNLLYTSDGGETWQDGKTRSGSVLSFSVSFNNSLGYLGGYTSIATGYNPLLFKTNDNGQTWSDFQLSSNGKIYSISISPVDPSKACAVGNYINDPVYGNQGLIMRTSDGGQTWSEEQWPGEIKLNAVHASSTDFFIAGDNGLLLKSSYTVGISSFNSEIPSGYSLGQNYPNPFNPTTKINFSIPKSGNVKLTVYNLVGQEVSVILNQNLNVGNYNFDFDASNLNSGVYFYTLQSENFRETKRMVLLK